jgi:uncharacterized protein involved in exopolysaccharide biosynthesis
LASQSLQIARRNTQPPLSLRDALTPAFYFGRQVLVAFLVPVLIGLAAAAVAKPVYVAQSKLLVLLAGDYVYAGDAGGAGAGLSLDRLQIMHAEQEILGSRALRLAALRQIGAARAYGAGESLNAAADRLERDLKIANVPQSNVIELTLRNGDPVVARQLLDRIVALYIQRRPDVFGRIDAQRIAPEQAQLQARLAASEAALLAFSNAHQIGDYGAALLAAQARQAALEDQLAHGGQAPARGARGPAEARSALTRELAKSRARLTELVDIGPRYRALSQDRTLAEAGLQELKKRIENARIDSALAAARDNIRVVQPAEVATRPESGRIPLIVAGVVVGLIAAAATAAVMNALSEVMVSPHDVETRLGLPTVLAAKPRRRRQGFPGDPQLAAEHLDQNDALQILSLLARATGTERGMVELISAGTGEGASALTIDLALLAAQRTDLRILVMDVEPAPGQEVIAQLTRRGAVFRPDTPASGLSRLGDTLLHVSQPIGANGWRLTESDWTNCVAYARENFDLVIIHAPALEAAYTGVAASTQADLTLVVVEAEKTRVAVAANLIDRLSAVGARVGGVVLNGRRLHMPRALYDRL